MQRQTYVITNYGVEENCQELQTNQIQAVFDLCRDNGGVVVVPKGRFYTGGLRMWSDTTLYLKEGAELFGSDECEDYTVFTIPEGVEVRSDLEMISQYVAGKLGDTYRRAILSIYGENNVAIIGEKDSVIDGANCYDADGEEGYRGPHGIYMTGCTNVLLQGYTIQHSGNFLHEVNNCTNVTMRNVTCLGGSDGIHMHCTTNTLIEKCLFKTGDDCVGGININGLHVRDCILNTSCNLFRIGGVHILVENCYAYGPGYYPHRMTIVRGKKDYLPREEGRHNMLYVIDYFASSDYPYEPSRDIVFRNCIIENAKSMLSYHADREPLQAGTHLCELTLENVRFTGLHESADVRASAKEPLIVKMKNVSVFFRDDLENTGLFDGKDEHTSLVEETVTDDMQEMKEVHNSCSALAAQIREYIYLHMEENISVKRLCDVFFISKNKLYNISNRWFGMTIGNYITSVRIEEAKRLLFMTEMPVSQIGLMVGISDYNYFARFFKSYTGMSPLKYRKSTRISIQKGDE